MSEFSASVSSWIAESVERTEAVFKESAQDVIEAANRPQGKGGNMPVDTGFLRASVRLSLEGPITAIIEGEGGTPQPIDYTATIANAQIGDTLHAAWTAKYARRINFGFSGEDSLGRSYSYPGTQFLGLALQKWPQIVNANVARLSN